MTVVIFRVPGCLSVPFKQLELLADQGLFDAYEVRNNNSEIVLYWRELEPSEAVTIQLGLPQQYSASKCMEKPSSGYLYYSKEDVSWSYKANN